MSIVFDKCTDALEYASRTKTFGVFYSTENSHNTNIHTHECCEILLLKKGGSNFLIDGKVYDATDSSLFFMNQFEPHKITFSDGEKAERWVLQIHPEFMLNFSTGKTNLAKCFYAKNEKNNKIQLDNETFDCIYDYFQSLNKEYEFADDIIKQNIVIQMLIELNLLAKCSGAGADADSYPVALKNAITYINANFDKSIGLDDVAKNSYISVNQLCRLFKCHLGTTVSKYITSKRISEAKKYLNQGKSVARTAEICGFNDYSSFIRTFAKYVGISPGKYYRES